MISIKARNVRLRKIDTTEKACGLVASFLASTKKEEATLVLLFDSLCSKWNRCLNSTEMGAFRRRAGLPESTLHVLLSQLEENELIRKVPAAQ